MAQTFIVNVLLPLVPPLAGAAAAPVYRTDPNADKRKQTAGRLRTVPTAVTRRTFPDDGNT